MTVKIQSVPLVIRYEQYRQISSSQFLVSQKDRPRSENTLKIETLAKKDFDVNPSLKMQEKNHMQK